MTDDLLIYLFISTAFLGGTLFGVMLVRFVLERVWRKARSEGRDTMVEP